MKKKPSLTLTEDFVNYCKVNEIEDVEGFAKELFEKAFLSLKYPSPSQTKRETVKDEKKPSKKVSKVKKEEKVPSQKTPTIDKKQEQIDNLYDD